MREFGAAPSDALMIGDTTHDLLMALNAGCASVGVSYGAHEPGDFGARRCGRWPLVAELHRWLSDNACPVQTLFV